ncbi:hypothetical protein [Clostridium akagii]|uniref:hypothetical protein n=1 Tax=Clostridium akagii TaxID=91623 RepID=UPI00047B3DF7|nr:hypothetical protein [Clostridium akagii]
MQLYVNSREIIINNLVSYMTLDSVLKEAYNDTYANLNNIISGDYPYFHVGKNIITWVGNITKIEIIPNWCYL